MLEVSLRLFVDGGPEALSMRKLAAEVGVAPMSLYRYFPSKAHLMRHIWRDIVARASAHGHAACETAPGPEAALRAYLDGFLQYWLSNPEHYRVVFGHITPPAHADSGADSDDGDLRPDCSEVFEALDELLADGATDRPPGPPREAIAAEIFCMLAGILLVALGPVHTPVFDPHRLRQQCLDSLMARLRPPSAAV